MEDRTTPDLVRIGCIGRPHGVKGAVTIVLDHPSTQCVERLSELFVRQADGTVQRLETGPVLFRREGRIALFLSGIQDRESAASLTRLAVEVDRRALDLDDSDLLVSDLVGRNVVCGEREVGTVSSTYHNGVHDVMVVQTAAGLVDFPVTETHVQGLDEQARVVVEGFEWFEDLVYPPTGRR